MEARRDETTATGRRLDAQRDSLAPRGGDAPCRPSMPTSAPDAEPVIGDLAFQAIGITCTNPLPWESAWWSEPVVHTRGL